MISHDAIIKLIVIFSIIYAILVLMLISILPHIGITGLSDLRVVLGIATVFELVLLYLFTSGWRKLWKRVPKLNEWVFPDLNGEWNAKIKWNWKGASGCKDGVVQIKQSIIKMSVNLETDESESTTLMVKPFKEAESGQPAFYYIYRSESKGTGNRAESDHKGAAILKLDLKNNKKMSGNYFTDRETFGRYEFLRET